MTYNRLYSSNLEIRDFLACLRIFAQCHNSGPGDSPDDGGSKHSETPVNLYHQHPRRQWSSQDALVWKPEARPRPVSHGDSKVTKKKIHNAVRKLHVMKTPCALRWISTHSSLFTDLLTKQKALHAGKLQQLFVSIHRVAETWCTNTDHGPEEWNTIDTAVSVCYGSFYTRLSPLGLQKNTNVWNVLRNIWI